MATSKPPADNMALTSPDTTAADVDHHTAVFSEMARELCP